MSAALAVTTIAALAAAATPAVANPGAAPAAAQSRAANNVPGEVVVGFKPGKSERDRESARSQASARRVDSIGQLDVELLSVPAGSESRAIEALRRNPNVEFAEPNMTTQPTYIPPEGNYWAYDQTLLPAAWDRELGTTGTIIAVLDSGSTLTTPDVRTVAGYDVADNDSNVSDALTHNHGDQVASVAASDDDGTGSAGSCPNCRVMHVKIVNDGSRGASTFDMADGFVWASDHGADIINLSYGYAASSTVLDAARYAWRRTVPIYWSAGNDNTLLTSTSPDYDSAADKEQQELIIQVAATQSDGTRSGFSNHGQVIDIAAPGSSVRLTTDTGGTGYASGTSFASPFAAGIGGLAESENPYITGQQIQHNTYSNARALTFVQRGLVTASADVTDAGTYTNICTGVPQNVFTDTASDHAECMHWYHILRGTSSTTFSPGTNVTRAQAATALVNLLHHRGANVPKSPADYFDDDAGSVHEKNINTVAELGITGGCGTRQFCPDNLVVKGQLATFLSKTHRITDGYELTSTTDYFDDDNGSVHEPHINGMAARSIMPHCQTRMFCPNLGEARGNLASDLARWAQWATRN